MTKDEINIHLSAIDSLFDKLQLGSWEGPTSQSRLIELERLHRRVSVFYHLYKAEGLTY